MEILTTFKCAYPSSHFVQIYHLQLFYFASSSVVVRKSTEYTGTLSTTKSGRTCQYWNMAVTDTENKENALPNNYCRDPDSKTFIWCYLPDSTWEKCDQSVLTQVYHYTRKKKTVLSFVFLCFFSLGFNRGVASFFPTGDSFPDEGGGNRTRKIALN